jgi:hypothetical protein
MNSRVNLLALLAILLASCAAPKVAQDYQRDSVITTIREEVIYKDSIIFIPLPMGNSTAILPDTDTSRLETDLAISEAYVSKGKLHHNLRNKNALLPVEIKFPKYVYTKNDYLVRERKIIEQIEVEKQLSRWQSFIMSLGYGLLISAVIWLAVRLARFV